MEKVAKHPLVKPEKVTAGAENASESAGGASNIPAPASKSFYSKISTNVEHITAEALAEVAQTVGGGGRGNGVMSLNICCAKGNRHSIKLSKSLYTGLMGEIDEDAEPKEICVLIDGTNLIISESLPDATLKFQFSNQTSMMVYSVPLVKLIERAFNLDYSNGKTSRAFQRIELVTPEKGSKEKPYAIVDMTRPLKK